MQIFELVGQMTIDGLDKTNKELSGLEKNVQKAQKGMKILGAAFTAVGVAGLAIVASTKKINAQLGVTAINLGITTKEMRDLTLATTNVTFPIEEVVKTFDLLARAGIKDQKVLAATATAFDTLGDALGMGASAVTEVMVPAMKTFRLSAEEIADKTDAMTYMVRNSTISLEDFNTMVGYTSQEMVEAGLTIDDMAAAMMYMSDNGVEPGKVMLREWNKAVTQSQKEGIALTEALGMTSAELEIYKGKLAGATGLTQEYADVANEQYTIMDKMKQKWSELTLGASGFLEPLEPILAGVTALGPLMIALSTSVGTSAIRWVAATVAVVAHKVAILAVTIAVRAATAAQWLWNAALAASPIGLIALAIGALVTVVTLVASSMGKAAEKTEEYTSEALSAWRATKDLTESLAELERVTGELAFAEGEITRVEALLSRHRTTLAKRTITMGAAEEDLIEVTKEAVDVEWGLHNATDGLTAANIRYADELGKKTKLTESDIRWLQIYRGAIATTRNAQEKQREELEAGIKAEEERIRKFEDFFSAIEKVGEEFDFIRTEAGKLSVTMDDLVGYMKNMGMATDESAFSMEKFAKYGDDVNAWAEDFGINLEHVARISGKTTDDMLDDIRDLTDEAKDAARDRTRAEIDAIDDRMRVERDAHQERMDALREEYDETIRIIDAELSHALRGYQDQLDAIDQQLEAIDDAQRQQRDAERKEGLEARIAAETDADRRADLEDDLNELLIKSGNEQWQDERKLAYEARIAEETDAFKRLELEAELAEFLLGVQRERTKKQLADEKDAIRERMELAREEAIAARDRAEEEYERDKERLEEKFEDFITTLENEKIALDLALEEQLARYDADLKAFEELLAQEIVDTENFVAQYNALMDKLEDKIVTITTVHRDVYVGTGGYTPPSPTPTEPPPWTMPGPPPSGLPPGEEWFQKGGIFDFPKVIGVGEKGPEAVIPLSRESLEKLGFVGGGPSITILEMNVREEADIDRIARELYRLQQGKVRAGGG